jgi:hypothetical protein
MFSLAHNKNEDKYFLVSSGSLGKELIEIVKLHNRIVFVFIFCQNVEYHLAWAKEYPKIKLVTNSLGTLLKHF